MLDWDALQRALVELGFTLNTRELAGLLWLAVLVLGTLSISRKARSTAVRLLRAASAWKLLVVVMCFFAWIALWVWMASKTFLWTPSLTKDTLYWTTTAGIALMFGHEKAAKPGFFRRAVLAALGITAFMQYLLHLSSFPLGWELLLQPLIALTVCAATLSRTTRRTQTGVGFADVLLGLIWLTLLAYTVADLHSARSSINWADRALEFLLPVWLTVVALPYVCTLGLVANYELAFIHLNRAAKGNRAHWWSKLALVCELHLRARDVRSASAGGTYDVASGRSFSEARRAAASFRKSLRERDRAEREKQVHLVQYAGSQETDTDGRRLDRREFDATMRALRWLAACHMGWYRRENRYRDDLLMNILDGDFTQQGLPRESGIAMRVSKDGQSWYAWRRIITGWCFAVGASGPPPNQWKYDGPELPSGFPGEAPAWGETPFTFDANRNWD